MTAGMEEAGKSGAGKGPGRVQMGTKAEAAGEERGSLICLDTYTLMYVSLSNSVDLCTLA